MDLATIPLTRKRKNHLSTDHPTTSVNMDRVAAVVLGGGQGTRLFPLTSTRCKPAISYGGKYRLIDIPVSNALNSGCHKIYIITQFLSSSLHKHILRTYHFSSFSSGFVEVLAAEQKPSQKTWFQGTADAVRQNLTYLVEAPVDYFLILSGDQLYNFDFQKMVQFASETEADLVIATTPVDEKNAKRMGIMKVNESAVITDFYEKPQERETLERLKTNPSFFQAIGLSPSNDKHYLGSMGIYLFKRKALIDLLLKDNRDDFGKHIIPTQLKKGNTVAYLHEGYWEDIGTIEAFHNANIAMTQKKAEFNCYDEQNPIFTTRENLCGPKIENAKISQSIICEGAVIDAKEITESILGPRTIVKQGTCIRKSYIMGNDFYTPPIHNLTSLPNELSIGKNCLLENVILDRNVHIGDNVQLINKQKLEHYDADPIYIRDGIIVVTRGSSVPNNFVL